MEPGIQTSSSQLYGDHDATIVLIIFRMRVRTYTSEPVSLPTPILLVAGLKADQSSLYMWRQSDAYIQKVRGYYYKGWHFKESYNGLALNFISP